MGRIKNIRSVALILAAVLVVMSLLPLLTSCGSVYEIAQQQFQQTEQMARDVVNGNEVTLDNTIKQDYMSAGDIISGTNNEGEPVYYDEKSEVLCT